jgi:hypothetical protein
MTKQISKHSLLLLTLFFALFAYTALIYRPLPAGASVIQGNEYQSTSTAASTLYGAQTAAEVLLKTGNGSLAQVTITGANTGIVNFYNATTSNSALRTGQVASSSILIASFPASTAAGTYTFDASFVAGLLMVRVGGNQPTSTIMWR